MIVFELTMPHVASWNGKWSGADRRYINWLELEDNCIERYSEPLIVIPTVDAVPVIRCKDCKWYDTEYHCKLNGYGCGRSPGWFCADGKKEEE